MRVLGGRQRKERSLDGDGVRTRSFSDDRPPDMSLVSLHSTHAPDRRASAASADIGGSGGGVVSLCVCLCMSSYLKTRSLRYRHTATVRRQATTGRRHFSLGYSIRTPTDWLSSLHRLRRAADSAASRAARDAERSRRSAPRSACGPEDNRTTKRASERHKVSQSNSQRHARMSVTSLSLSISLSRCAQDTPGRAGSAACSSRCPRRPRVRATR